MNANAYVNVTIVTINYVRMINYLNSNHDKY